MGIDYRGYIVGGIDYSIYNRLYNSFYVPSWKRREPSPRESLRMCFEVWARSSISCGIVGIDESTGCCQVQTVGCHGICRR